MPTKAMSHRKSRSIWKRDAAPSSSLWGLASPGQRCSRQDQPPRCRADAITDADIFNFALNLEYLEAEFYLRASVGQGLADAEVTGTGTLGPVSGGRAVPFRSQVIANYANEIARDERLHVNTLRAALGSNAVARPAIDLGFAFTIRGPRRRPCGSERHLRCLRQRDELPAAAFIFEDVGVTAYHGAARSSKTRNLSGAAGILAVEAYHAGIIRTVLYSRGLSLRPGDLQRARLHSTRLEKLDEGIGDATTLNLVPLDRLASPTSVHRSRC